RGFHNSKVNYLGAARGCVGSSGHLVCIVSFVGDVRDCGRGVTPTRDHHDEVVNRGGFRKTDAHRSQVWVVGIEGVACVLTGNQCLGRSQGGHEQQQHRQEKGCPPKCFCAYHVHHRIGPHTEFGRTWGGVGYWFRPPRKRHFGGGGKAFVLGPKGT